VTTPLSRTTGVKIRNQIFIVAFSPCCNGSESGAAFPPGARKLFGQNDGPESLLQEEEHIMEQPPVTMRWTNHPDVIEEVGRFRFEHLIAGCGLPAPAHAIAQRSLIDPADRDSMHLVVHRGPELAGALRLDVNRLPPWLRATLPGFLKSILREHEFGYVSRCVVSEVDRGRTIFPAMLAEAYRIGRRFNLTIGVCHSRPDLRPLYQRLGWVPCTRVFDHPLTGPQIVFFRCLPGEPQTQVAKAAHHAA
jgi:hypothetical protein